MVVRSGAVLLLALVACGDDAAHDTCLPACEGARDFDAIAYDLHARFDAPSQTLHASVDVTVVLGASNVIALDAQLVVDAVRAEGGTLPFTHDVEANLLRIDLRSIAPATAGEPVRFTIDYDAPTSIGLVHGGPRDDDPVTSRVLFTDSEPMDGMRWLPAKHDPADRALFSVELTLAPGEDMVANGERVADEMVAGGRRIGYRLDQPIPTYIMAFAAGDLEQHERLGGRVPIVVWHRRGLVLDVEAHLDLLAAQMATFEALVGPYPWSRYAVVLLPQFGGGMENATITFNSEASGQGDISFYLNAHELAHQWFGDWVTMRTFGDLWTKEGMATFLAAEASRAYRDAEARGRLFANDFSFFRDSPISALTESGLPIYGTGPYERAAWLITQLRVTVGDAAFWAGLRRVLDEHALDSVSGDDFVRAFTPALDEASRARVMATIERADLATITASAGSDGAFTFTLDDQAASLLAPLEVTVVDAAGAAVRHTLPDRVPVTVTVPPGGYLAPDERGVHPEWPDVFDDGNGLFDAYVEQMVPRFVPQGSSAALADLGARAPSHQERAMFARAPLPPAADFAAFYQGLDSSVARQAALLNACFKRVSMTPELRAAYDPVLAPLLRAPPIEQYGSYGTCGVDLTAAAFGDELADAVDALATTDPRRLEYLLAFDHGPAGSLALIGRVAREAPSLRLRDRALSRLSRQLLAFTGYSQLTSADVPAWRAFFRERYPLTTSAGRLQVLFDASYELDDVAALDLVAPLLRSVPMTETRQVNLVCDANRLAAGDPAAWVRFQDALRPWDTLWPRTAEVLADPASCPPFRLAPPRDPFEAQHDLDVVHDHARLPHAH